MVSDTDSYLICGRFDEDDSAPTSYEWGGRIRADEPIAGVLDRVFDDWCIRHHTDPATSRTYLAARDGNGNRVDPRWTPTQALAAGIVKLSDLHYWIVPASIGRQSLVTRSSEEQ